MMLECIKQGFRHANKNLQLLVIRIVVSIVNIIGLFLFLGLPAIAAVVYLGFDISHAKEMVPFFVNDPFTFISKYLGLMFLMGTAFLLYLTFSSILILYALGGTLGVLKNSAVNSRYTFTLSSFFEEARANFSRLLWMMSLLLLIVIALFVLFVMAGGIAAAISNAFTETGSAVEMFFSSFALLTMIVFSVLIVLIGLVFGVYSVVVLVTDGKGVMESVNRTYNFLKRTPKAVLYYFILVLGFIVANTVFYGIEISASTVPLFMPVLYIINSLFQSYLAIVIWSSLIAFYVKTSNYPVVYSSFYEI